MAKATTLTFLLLLLACAAAQESPTPTPEEAPSQEAPEEAPSQSGNPAPGLDEACKTTPDPTFCSLFLRPYSAVFASNDANKIGFTAINATVGQVKSTKTFMTREAFNDKTSKVHDAMMTCVSRTARCEGNLKLAAREFSPSDADIQRKIPKADPKKMLDSATNELNACLDVLNKTTAGDGGGDNGSDVALTASRKVKDSIIACSVAKSLIP